VTLARDSVGRAGAAGRARFHGGVLRGLVATCALAASAACGEESPTDVGGSLLPGQAIRTIEVVLDPASFLARDTSFSGYSDPALANFFVLAKSFQGVLDAHALARFDIPKVIAVTDSAGTLRSDSAPRFFAGRIVLQIDTPRSAAARPFTAHAVRIEEPWDPASTTWTHRIDTAGVREPWRNPGGTGGRAIGSGTVAAGMDSLVIPVDSATLAAWADSANTARGALIMLEAPNARVRASDFVLRADARSSIRRDTVVTVTLRPPNSRFIFHPRLPAAAAATLVGGNPAWRTYMEFREGLDTLTVACPTISATCRIRLRDASITFGSLLLVPAAAPAGFTPEDTMQVTVRALISTPEVPLARSLLGDIMGVARRFVRPAEFAPPAGGNPVEVSLTDFVLALTRDTLRTGPRPTRWLAVMPLIESIDFGIAAFQPVVRLRLVLTIGSELQLR